MVQIAKRSARLFVLAGLMLTVETGCSDHTVSGPKEDSDEVCEVKLYEQDKWHFAVVSYAGRYCDSENRNVLEMLFSRQEFLPSTIVIGVQYSDDICAGLQSLDGSCDDSAYSRLFKERSSQGGFDIFPEDLPATLEFGGRAIDVDNLEVISAQYRVAKDIVVFDEHVKSRLVGLGHIGGSQVLVLCVDEGDESRAEVLGNLLPFADCARVALEY